MKKYLTFTGAVRREPAIDKWFDGRRTDLSRIARPWFERMRECGADVSELLHDGHPTVCVDEAAFGYVNIFKAHVNVGFFHGAALQDPAGLLEGTGKYMRHVKLRPGADMNSRAMQALITAAYQDIKTRLEQG